MENADPMFSAFAAASSSSNSSQKEYYDVFLSFRGKDTRKNFTGHLREALRQKGFHTFFDDDKLGRGKEIPAELPRAIEDSRSSVVVFSENYANSSWCLTELAKIVECKGTSGNIILPIFYHVDPSHVRDQTGSYGQAFSKHEQNSKHNREMVQTWRDALKEVGSLAGWHVTRDTTDEAEFIKDFIVQISRMLDVPSSNFSQGLFGMESRLEKFKSVTISPSLDIVRFIGICGMGGIGKTTLAKAYYYRIRHKFDGSSFLANIREICEEKKDGLEYLQQKLLSNILKEKDTEINDVDQGKSKIRSRLRKKKVLIVLDDVNKLDQLEALADQKDERFGAGSLIIVTTRDQSVLRSNGINIIYEAELLNSSEAFQLFTWKAFKSINPPEIYKELCKQVIEYANGLPLAVAVLGSFLCGKKRINDWESALKRLREYSRKEIIDVLIISFADLEETDQDIFLHIACFFKEYDKDLVSEILDSCGFNTKYGINNLVEKSLLSIQHNKLCMHDLLQKMGKEIVRATSRDEPGRRSRIWDVVDFYHTSENETEMDKVEAIVTFLEGNISLSFFEAISRMKNLRLLMILGSCFLCENDSLILKLEYLSNELRFLQWDKFPYKGFPSSFRPYRLVQLKLLQSSIEKLWNNSTKPLCNLKIIDLSMSQNFTKFEDFRVVPYLETLILEGCIKLSEIHDSITSLDKLIFLNLASCVSLNKLPKLIHGMTSLEILNLNFCSQLSELPEDCGYLKNLKEVDVRNTGIKQLPSSIFLVENLTVRCHEKIANPNVKESVINFCRQLCEIPKECGHLNSLKEDDVTYRGIRHLLPSKVLEKNHKALSCSDEISKLQSSILLMENLEFLCHDEIAYSSATEGRINSLTGDYFLLGNLRFLKELSLSNRNLLDGLFPVYFGELVSLEKLNLSENPFSSLPYDFSRLSKLKFLNLMYCKFLRSLGSELPSSLETVRLDYCTSLTRFLDPLRPCDLRCSVYCVGCMELVKRQDGELMALTSLNRYIKDPTHLIRPFDIVIPGNEISPWFIGQSLGPSISVKLDRTNWNNNKWMGIAFAACFYASTFNDELRCLITIGGCRTKKPDLVTLTRKIDVRIRSSSHLWLSYSPRAYYSKGLQYGSDVVIEFSFYIYGSNNSCCGPCGVRLVYEEDVEELTQITINKSAADQEDVLHYDSPSKRKRDDLELVRRLDGKNIASTSHHRLLQVCINLNIRFDVALPTSKIPTWFVQRSPKSIICTELYPHWYNNEWMGFALCASVSANDESSSHDLFCEISFNGNVLDVSKDGIMETGISHHIWLLYLTRDYFPRDWLRNSSGNIKFSFYSKTPFQNLNSCFESCGLRLVYQKDKEEFYQIMSKYRNLYPS